MNGSVVVTGGTGFIGSALLRKLISVGFERIFVLVRETTPQIARELCPMTYRDFFDGAEAAEAMKDVNTIIHLAGRAHVTHERGSGSPDVFRESNIELSAAVARRAAELKVPRFIFLSSIGVNGSESSSPLRHDDPVNPQDLYAISKLEAERRIKEILDDTDTKVTIIRPPLVYGKNAPGNFSRLVAIVNKGWPLPVGLIDNRRSLVYIENLVDLILRCIHHADAADQVFLVSDGETVSTPELIRKIGLLLKKRVILLPVPVSALRGIGAAFGREKDVARLCSSLVIDIDHVCKTLDWTPPFSFDEAMSKSILDL